MPKIHYKHPQLGYHACGVRINSLSKSSSDIKQVNCQKCLETVTGKRRSPGKPVTGKAKIKVTIRLPQELVDWIDKQGDRTSVITSILADRRIRTRYPPNS
ncbi:hypothetical protein [Nostoc piscinale]|uniref:hypothetical protein n=1 Tax=Nostoc piscinale TaxID=224012 RepID=UPI0011876F24|nr:hypothetical protein [Nostoc piscinale]